MTTKTCTECKEPFKLTEIGGGQPHKPEKDSIKCPYCGDTTYEKTTGYFLTEKLALKK